MFKDDTRVVLWEHEHLISIDITPGMFSASKIVGGVRMFPYVEVGFAQYYLEGKFD